MLSKSDSIVAFNEEDSPGRKLDFTCNFSTNGGFICCRKCNPGAGKVGNDYDDDNMVCYRKFMDVGEQFQ